MQVATFYIVCLLADLAITAAMTLVLAKMVHRVRQKLVSAVCGLAIPCVLLCLAMYYYFVHFYRCDGLISCFIIGLWVGVLIKAALLVTPFSLAASFSVIKLVDQKNTLAG